MLGEMLESGGASIAVVLVRDKLVVPTRTFGSTHCVRDSPIGDASPDIELSRCGFP